MVHIPFKQALSDIFNKTLTDLWLASSFKHKIFVGGHNIECSGGIRASRYKNIQTGRFDDIHLHGSSGKKAYTHSVLNILKGAGLVEKDFDHQNCSQTIYQAKQKNFNRHKVWPFDRDIRKPIFLKEQNTVPLHNRFAVLNEEYLGNY